MKTYPIPVHFLTQPSNFVYGPRVEALLRTPFSTAVLKKRVMRKAKDGGRAEAAYFIDLRDMGQRINWVVGACNWEMDIELFDLGDRVGAVSTITIAGNPKRGESEAPKIAARWDRGTKAMVDKYNELAVRDAGPNATKRAAVMHGIGEYLYRFKEVNTWEEIDQYGNFKNSDIDIKKLPHWAIPPAGPALVLQELGLLFNIDVPSDLSQLTDEDSKTLGENLKTYWGVSTLKSEAGFTEEDYFRLAGCMARINDYLSVNGGELNELLETRNIKVKE